MKILGIIQARMGSTRLPGKVMREVKGKPMIGYMLDRVSMCRELNDFVVAIPKGDFGSSLHKYVANRGIAVYAGGEENDLCERITGVLEMYLDMGAFVRLCADSPMIDAELIDVMAAHIKIAKSGFVSNVGMKMLPQGLAVEICSRETYRDICKLCKPEDREHAGFPWVYRYMAERKLTVDTEEDFQRFAALIECMEDDHINYPWPECVNLLARS